MRKLGVGTSMRNTPPSPDSQHRKQSMNDRVNTILLRIDPPLRSARMPSMRKRSYHNFVYPIAVGNTLKTGTYHEQARKGVSQTPCSGSTGAYHAHLRSRRIDYFRRSRGGTWAPRYLAESQVVRPISFPLHARRLSGRGATRPRAQGSNCLKTPNIL